MATIHISGLAEAKVFREKLAKEILSINLRTVDESEELAQKSATRMKVIQSAAIVIRRQRVFLV